MAHRPHLSQIYTPQGPAAADHGARLCYSACRIGSDAISLIFAFAQVGADQSRLKEINLRSAVHLSLDKLELGDLAFGLAV
jgi:hypothetical protein